MTSLRDGFVEGPGIKLHYLANTPDTKKPSLMFVPGVMMPAWIWEKQLEYFAKDFQVIALDIRSHGMSQHSSEGHYALALAQDIETVINALDVKNLTLVGWSLGVPQVLNYALHFGATRLKALVLVDGIVGIDPSVSFYKSMIDQWTAFQTNRPYYTEKFIKSMFKKTQPEAYLSKLKEAALTVPTNTVMTLMYNYIVQDFRPFLERVTLPVWIAAADGPRLDYMKKMRDLFPHAEIDVFLEAGHALFIDQPEKFNQSLEAFIKKAEEFSKNSSA